MSILADVHKTLTDGKGKCSVPMWSGGCPSGFCDKDAFGERPASGTWYNYAAKKEMRDDGRYNGYVPGLACKSHGGPPCPGIEIEPSVFSGCDQSAGDCPTCGH